MGRPAYGGRATCESCKSIDVRRWHRNGLLSAGQHFTNSWTFGGLPAGTISVTTQADAVMLTYSTHRGDAGWKPISQRVPVTWTDCKFGGRRPWFVCSGYTDGRHCGRRVAILYGAGAYFACRHCYGLAYETQQQSARWRGFTKAQKIRMRLDGSVNLLKPFPQKPPRLHWRTYKRLHRAYALAKDRSLRGVLGRHPSELP
jgi:hypothetical protein